MDDLLAEIESSLRETTMDEIVQTRVFRRVGVVRGYTNKAWSPPKKPKKQMLELSVTWTPKQQAQFKKI